MKKYPRCYLKNMRTKCGMSQADAGLELGITQQYYDLIERGERLKHITLDMLTKLSNIFEIQLTEIIELERKYQEDVNAQNNSKQPLLHKINEGV